MPPPAPIEEYGLSELASGEFAGARVVEVLRIPHESALEGLTGDTSPLEASVAEARSLLHDLHQVHLGHASGALAPRDVAMELLWRSVAADGQIHRATVELSIVLRALAATTDEVVATLRELEAIVVASLSSSGYDFAALPGSELRKRGAAAVGPATVALVREEWLELTGSTSVPEVYAVDRVPLVDRGLDRIANSLIEYPDSSVTVQIVPTTLSVAEKAALEDMALKLGTLARGVHDPSVGTVRFHVADVRARTYDHYAEHKDGPLHLVNVVVRGDAAAVPVIAARVHSHLSAGSQDGPFSARFLEVSELGDAVSSATVAAPWRLLEHLMEQTRDDELWRRADGQSFAALSRLPWLMTSEEVAQVGRLPIADRRLGAGFEVTHTERASRNYSRGVVGSSEIPVGYLKGSSHSVEIGFRRPDLTKHLFVAGTPGSGKTTFMVGLIDRLWREHGVPTLVIEPAKNEYRALVETIPDLQVFTPGKSHLSPFVFNPFLPPAGVRLEAYKSVLRTAFAAGLTMTSPLDRIFDDAVNRAYARFGWLDEHTVADGGQVFTILDFVAVFRETFDRIGYTGDARNIGRAGLVRLQGLLELFDTERSIPISTLLERPTVIELGAIENAEQKALLIALILLGVLAHVNANLEGDNELKHAILLEEAHVLLDADERPAASGDADPTTVAKRLVKRMLAEARAYGVSLMIADQSPRKVSADVVALTGVKLGFRLVEEQDRAIFAGSTNLSESQRERLGRLTPGQAFLFYDRLEAPEEVVTPDHRLARGIPAFVTDEQLKQRSTFWRDHAHLRVPFDVCDELPEWDPARASVARQIAQRIFDEHFPANATEVELLERVYRRLPALSAAALRHDPDRTLLGMIALYLLRAVRSRTDIALSEPRLRASLRAFGRRAA